MQDFDVLDQSRIDKVTRGIGKAACIKLVAERYTVYENGDPVAPDTANIDPLGAEARAASFMFNARHVTKHVADRSGELGIQFAAGNDRDVGRYVSNRALVLVCDHDDLVDDIGRSSFIS